MITRGWILPDKTEHQISVGDSFFKGFVQSLELLEERNPSLYQEVLDRAERYLFNPEELLQYAIEYLDFMMVGEYNMNVVACAKKNYDSDALEPYKEDNWTIHVINYER